jgi:dTDP-4-amino-4,6-dideoxygalactose transaminase
MTIVTMGAQIVDNGRVVRRYHSSAREGFEAFLRHALDSQNNRVLLPAFIGWSPREGSGVFDPVRRSSAEAHFYTLNEDLTVDLAALEAALAENHPRILLLIHYFGRREPRLNEVARLAAKYKAILVEDLAHGLFTAASGIAGRAGPVSLYSLHKMLPVADGGMIEFRNGDFVPDEADTRPELEHLLASYDLSWLGARRRENFLTIRDKLSALSEHGEDFELMWPTLEDDEVPQTLPVRVLNGRRDAIYREMNLAGFGMTSLYHTLIQELEGGFETMQRVARSITNFPVHQDMSPSAAEPMVAKFREVLRA